MIKSNESSIIRALHESSKINLLKASNLSSAEYEKAKKLKGFNKDDWKWDPEQECYTRVEECDDNDDKKENVDPSNEHEDNKVNDIQGDAEDKVEDDFIDDEVYQCTSCKEYFTSSIELTGNVICPNCREDVAPVFIGEVDDVEFDESAKPNAKGELLSEVIVKIKGGKVVRLKKRPRKGYKLVNGKYVKMTPKERMARKKQGKKMSRKPVKAATIRKRKKSLKKGKARGLYDNFEVNEDVFKDLVNAAYDDIYSDISEQYVVPQVDHIVESFMSEEDELVIEAVVKYDDGIEEEVQFVVEGFKYETGEFTISESTETFGEGTVKIKFDVANESISPLELSYDIKVDNKQLSESFVVETEESNE